jgi:hypothetical protein
MTNNSVAADAAVRALVAEQVPELELPYVPRRFGIFEYDEEDELALLVWGIETPQRAMGFFADSASTIRATNAADVYDMFGRVRDVELVWLDDPGVPAAG